MSCYDIYSNALEPRLGIIGNMCNLKDDVYLLSYTLETIIGISF